MADSIRVPWRDSFILLRGHTSFLLAARVAKKFPLCIETEETEIVQGMYPGDLILISAPEGGDVLPAVYLAEQIRTFHFPLIALSKTHPASQRLSYVISANDKITLTGDCRRGTHPEQQILCAADEFAGMTLYCVGDDLIIENSHSGITISSVQWTPDLKMTAVI